MTEKTIKSKKNKTKHLKIKRAGDQEKATLEFDSDISEPELSEKPKKFDKKDLKEISDEVSGLLASLKRDHGIDSDVIDPPPNKKQKKLEMANKKNKNKNEAAGKHVIATNSDESKPAQENEKSKQKQNQKKKVAKPNANAGLATKLNGEQAEDDLTKKKKKKNKKRAATAEDDNDDELPAKKVHKNPNEKQKQKKKKPNAIAKQTPKTDETSTDGPKKEHHLKNAAPVFVGNLPINIKRQKLVKLFKKCGKVVSIRFRTNVGRPFYKKAQVAKLPFVIAFVYFETREAAEAAVQFDGTKIGDHIITVDLDTKDKVQESKPQNTVVVGNLKYAVTDNILREAFKCCGEIKRIHVKQTLKGCSGVAFINFVKPESSALALKLNGTTILDREVRVEKYEEKKEKKVKKEKTPKPQKMGKKNVTAAGAQNKQKSVDQAGVAKSNDINKKIKKNKEFMGAKSNDNKKKLNKKKKVKLSAEARLAKKVAPKSTKSSE